MQITNSDGKILSSSFESAITAPSQYVKPKVVVDFQDSRHLSNVVVSTNSDFSSQYPFSFRSVDGKLVNFVSASDLNIFASDGYVAFPGVAGSYVSVASSTDFDISGNVEVVMLLSMNQWIGSGVTQCLVSRFNNGGNAGFKIVNDGTNWSFYWSSNGSTVLGPVSVPVYTADFPSGSTRWARFRFSVSDRQLIVHYATNSEVEPFNVVWLLSGFSASGAATSLNPVITSSLVIGASDGGAQALAGKVYHVVIRNGYSGKNVLNIDFAAARQFQSFNYYFSKDQIVNGVDYETFAWGVADALDNYGKVITADGTYSAVPADLTDNYKYGWWSAFKSLSTGGFDVNKTPTLTLNFDPTIVNKIKVVTSSMFGQVKDFFIQVRSQSSGVILIRSYTYDTANFEYEKIINLDTTYNDIDQIFISVSSTKNGFDYARFISISPIYKVDISDYVMNVNSNRIRDLHETSLPIAGSSQSTCDIALDNSSKIFSLMNSNSQYGKFLQKDLRVYVYNGWKVSTVSSEFVETYLTALLPASGAALMSVFSVNNFPDGDVTNAGESFHYVVTVDKGKNIEEKILIKKKYSSSQFEIQQRGYAGTEAVQHAVNAPVLFDTFEYVNVGTFYIEDISSTTNGMDVNISLNDRFKFLNDKILDKGFFRLDSTVPDALRDLALVGNFPRNKFKSLGRFSDGASSKGAVLQLKCDDDTNSGYFQAQPSVRVRIYQFPVGLESNIKDLQIDAFEKQLSDLDKALGLSGSVTPTFTTNLFSTSLLTSFGDVSLSGTVSLGPFGTTFARKGFFNGVMDGYYVPITTNANCEIGVSFNYGGVRLYIDDNIVIDAWNEVTSLTYISGVYNFTAGFPYKIRLEFFHTYGSSSGVYSGFPMILSTGAARNVITFSELMNNVIVDNIGSRNPPIGINSVNRNKNQNSGVPSAFVYQRFPSSMGWNTLDSSIYIQRSTTGTVDSFVRIPYDSSWNASLDTSYPSKNWSLEVLISAGGGFGGQGEYISNWSNSASSTGFELFYVSPFQHGIRVKTSSGSTATVASAVYMSSASGWHHIVATYNSSTNTIYYYVNGVFNASASLGSDTPVWGTNDLTIGGRGAGFVSGVGVTKPTSSVSPNGITFYIDEFNIYSRTLSGSDVLDRYRETQIKEVRKFPFLFGFNESVFQSMQNISFADLGRFYIDEYENFVYEHYYAYFEPSLDRHAVSQQSFADTNFIIDADIKKTLQVNSVVVKVAGSSSSLIETQPVWRAPSPTTLGVVTLTSNPNAVANTISATNFDLVPFPKAGYIAIDKEIMKYSGISQTAFTGVERGVLGSSASSHISGSKVREVKWFNFEYDKHPVLSIKSPFITGILFEDPDEINILTWDASPFKANLVIAASDTVDTDSVVFVEGTNPLTNKVSYLSVAGVPVQIVQNKTQIQEQKAANSENRRKFGLKEVIIESPFINDPSQAQELASFIISKLAEPIPIMSMNTVLTPKIQVGDRISITSLDQFDIINSDFWVSSINMSIGSGYSQQVELRKVV